MFALFGLAVYATSLFATDEFFDLQARAGETPSVPCTCRYRGRDVLLGQTVCMKTNKGYVQARCGRYLNNTSWDITKAPCPVAQVHIPDPVYN